MFTNKPGLAPAAEPLRLPENPRSALFFDFDGVLADIADHPASVAVKPEVLDDLSSLLEATGGALAVVSGRQIAELDRFLAPLRLAAAGVHGAQRRSADGRRLSDAADEALIQRIWLPLRDFAKSRPGLVAERKPFSVALHYRGDPDMEHECNVLARQLAECDQRIHILRGKMVVELKTSPRTKGDAIRAFMKEPPFSGRRPIFFGDDVTDEDGFAEVNRLGGVSVKIGEGDTMASIRLADTETFRTWLDAAARCSGQSVQMKWNQA